MCIISLNGDTFRKNVIQFNNRICLKGSADMKQRSNCQKLIVVMIILLLGIFCISAASGEEEITIDETNFPDATFRESVEQYDTDGSGGLSQEEIDSVTSMTIPDQEIGSLEGIECFISLTDLRCYNNKLTTLDVSRNTALEYLDCEDNQLVSLDMSGNTALQTLLCSSNQLSSLDVSGNTALQAMYCSSNQLSSLDVSWNRALQELYCSYNQLSSLDMSENTALRSLYCNDNQLSSLNVSKNTVLETLDCSYNQLSSLDVSQNKELHWLTCNSNQLSRLDVSCCPALADVIKEYDPEEYSSILVWTADADGDDYEEVQLQVDKDVIIAGREKNAIAISAANFPDAVFREVVEQYDTDGSGGLSQEEIDAVTYMFISDLGIGSLEGIEYFTSLTDLRCYYNALTALDVSKNTALDYLDCDGNQLNSLDVSWNTALYSLYCAGNQLSSLDVSKNTALQVLGCSNNQLGSLDVSNNTALEYLDCSYNQLNSLNVSENTTLISLYCQDNQLSSLDVSQNTELRWLTCSYNQLNSLDVRCCTILAELISEYVPEEYDTILVWTADLDGDDYEDTQLQVDKNVTIPGFEKNAITINETHFPDEVFRAYVKQFDTDGSGKLSQEEIDAVTDMDVSGQGIESLEGIGYFSSLQALNCGENNLVSLNVSQNTSLAYLYCYSNKLGSLDLRENTALIDLYCFGNELSSLDVSKNTALVFLNCGDNQLSSLDVSKNKALTALYCYNNELSSLDVSKNIHLIYLNCNNNDLSALDLNRNTALEELDCSTNELNSLNVSKNTALRILAFDANQLSSLDVSKNTALVYLSGDNNKLTELDVSKNTALETIWCLNNKLTELDVSKNKALQFLICAGNRFSSLDVSHCPVLVDLISGNDSKVEDNMLIWDADTDGDGYSDIMLKVDSDVSVKWNKTIIAIDENNFPDPVFREYVKRFDTDGKPGLSQEEIGAVTEISVDSSGIKSLKGIEFFTKLTSLSCYDNLLTDLDVSQNTKLVYLHCGSNKLTSLDISSNINLETLFCFDNKLKALNTSKNTKMVMLFCGNNMLKKLDVSKNIALEQLYCFDNQLTSLNTSKNTVLRQLCCFNNQLTSLDVSRNNKLDSITCAGNKLTGLDISKCPILVKLVQNVKRVDQETYYAWEEKDENGEPIAVLEIDKMVELKTELNQEEKITAFVTRCYELILGRQPDAHGLETWYVNLNSGQKAAAEIIDSFVRSNEFKGKKLSNADAVEILYKTMLGRGSDPGGKANWVKKLDDGQPLAAVINGFCGSNEFKAICESYGIRPGSVDVPEEIPTTPDEKIKAFVKRCYKIILGRGADETGLNNWFRYLKNKEKAASEIIDGFVNSPEFLGKKYSNEESVEILYKAMLGRGSDPKGKANWVAKLNAGQPFAVVINGFCGSQEFRGLCESYGIIPGSVKVRALSGQTEEELSSLAYNAEEPITKRSEDNPNRVSIINPSDTIDPNIGTAVQAVYINEEKAKEFVSRCYQYILGRNPNGNELAGWVAQMTNGTKTADQIARGFLFSDEFKGRNVGNEDLVKILYRVYLNRGADPAGLASWTAKLDSGVTLKEVLDTLVKTGEHKNAVSEMGK